nr:hypothetical protein [Tanacetum cinerariifolium]
MSISALIKCTAAIRQFAYGSTAHVFDEYLQMMSWQGANNDINVLDNSPLFDDLLDDSAHVVPYVRQESTRKDVERAFGVLQGRWGLSQQPARAYEVNTLRRIRSMQTMWIDRCEPNVVKQKN